MSQAGAVRRRILPGASLDAGLQRGCSFPASLGKTQIKELLFRRVLPAPDVTALSLVTAAAQGHLAQALLAPREVGWWLGAADVKGTPRRWGKGGEAVLPHSKSPEKHELSLPTGDAGPLWVWPDKAVLLQVPTSCSRVFPRMDVPMVLLSEVFHRVPARLGFVLQ